MAPNTNLVPVATPKNNSSSSVPHNPPRLSMENLQRTISDISFELSKEAAAAAADHAKLPPISEIEDAKCECCGMSEECTPEYIKRMREKFSGKLICGLCAEAVAEEMGKNGGKREEALNEHMNACVRFNRLGRAYPVLCQAEAMREILKRVGQNPLVLEIKLLKRKVGLLGVQVVFQQLQRKINNQEIVN